VAIATFTVTVEMPDTDLDLTYVGTQVQNRSSQLHGIVCDALMDAEQALGEDPGVVLNWTVD
jgi:hypothetical protein